MALANPAPQPAPIRPAEFLQHHNVLVRRARDVAHQCFFFLDLLEPTTRRATNEAIEEYRPFALSQVRSLVWSIHLPDSYDLLDEQLADGTLQPMATRRRELERAVDLFYLWHDVFHSLRDLRSVDPAALRRQLADFLDRSRTESWAGRLHHHELPDLLGYLRKHLSQLWATFLVLALALQVEAVHSLLRNEGLAILVPLALLLIPLVTSRLLPGFLRRTQGTVPAWDLGGPPFRSLRHQAQAPGRMIQCWPLDRKTKIRKEIFRGRAMLLLAHGAWWLIAFACLSILSWMGELGGLSLTVFLVLSHFYALVLVARTLDFWDFLDPRPIRFALLLVSMLLLLALFAGAGREAVMVISLGTAGGYLLLSPHSRGFRSVVVLALLTVVAANYKGRQTVAKEMWQDEGAGWEGLGRRLGPGEWPWPAAPGSRTPVVVLAASGGGSRAAVYTGMTLMHLQDELPYIADQIQAISSVSGGSLANAAYVTRLLETSTGAELDDALQTDFLLPTLRGALIPGQTRGSAIEEDWRNGPVGLHDYHLSDLARRWRFALRAPSPVPPFPIPIFNSSTLDGHDVVISPLSKELYTRYGLDDEASDPQRNAYEKEVASSTDLPTWVYYRDGVYGLEDLLPRFDPLLSSAVRASANFPFGFPLVHVVTKRPLFFSPLREERDDKSEKIVHLTDGGALSNSGMWSLFNLLMHRDHRAALRERGVLLIVVEASRMPKYRPFQQAVNSLYGTIEDQGPVGQRLHREMLEILEMAYGDRIAVVQLDLIPRDSYNVLTTWALDQGSLDQLDKSFGERWKIEKEHLEQSWIQLTQPAPAHKPYIDRRRPPLD
jgi:predicted acylesterase/phospholipase RssA